MLALSVLPRKRSRVACAMAGSDVVNSRVELPPTWFCVRPTALVPPFPRIESGVSGLFVPIPTFPPVYQVFAGALSHGFSEQTATGAAVAFCRGDSVW